MEQDGIMNSQELKKNQTKPPCLPFLITSEEEAELQKKQVSHRIHILTVSPYPDSRQMKSVYKNWGSIVKAFQYQNINTPWSSKVTPAGALWQGLIHASWCVVTEQWQNTVCLASSSSWLGADPRQPQKPPLLWARFAWRLSSSSDHRKFVWEESKTQ